MTYGEYRFITDRPWEFWQIIGSQQQHYLSRGRLRVRLAASARDRAEPGAIAREAAGPGR
jgi:hypothetical protein